MPVWEGKGSFLDLLAADAEVKRHLTREALAAAFDDAYHTKHVDTIFKRVFG
jgi:adenylosuccinate lyase